MYDTGFSSADRAMNLWNIQSFSSRSVYGKQCFNLASAAGKHDETLLLLTLYSHFTGDCGRTVGHLHETTMVVIKHHTISFCFCLVSIQSFIQPLVRGRFNRLSSSTAQEVNWLDLIFWDI